MPVEINGESQIGKFVNANGINIYYESYGKGSALIFLHGSMGTGKGSCNIFSVKVVR
jgi:hypothetical protein